MKKYKINYKFSSDTTIFIKLNNIYYMFRSFSTIFKHYDTATTLQNIFFSAHPLWFRMLNINACRWSKYGRNM